MLFLSGVARKPGREYEELPLIVAVVVLFAVMTAMMRAFGVPEAGAPRSDAVPKHTTAAD